LKVLVLSSVLLASYQTVAFANTAVLTEDGGAKFQNNIYILETGPQENSSNIPLPTVLPTSVSEGVKIPTDSNRQAPSSLYLSVDDGYVTNSITQATGLQVVDYEVTINSRIDRVPGSHDFAEGITNEDGEALVRGDEVTKDLNGNVLPETNTLETQFSRGERAEVSVVNLRPKASSLSDSGVFLSESGEVLVEDLRNGGDKDFNDANLDVLAGGTIEADLEGVSTEVVTDTYREDWNLKPRTISNVLGFLDENQQPTDSAQVTLDSNGSVNLAYQSAPLFSLRRPTLLGVNLDINPFDQEFANLSVGATQFLTPIYDDQIVNQLSGQLALLPPAEGSGNGLAAYSNVGGVIINYLDGRREFLPQWTVTDILEESTYYNVNEVESFVQALIPEQEGTDDILVGQPINLLQSNLNIINRSDHPNNFREVSPLLTGVEDTLESGNSWNPRFDGIRREGTVDFNDAFLSLDFQRDTEQSIERQFRRAGLYVGANVSGGIGQLSTASVTTQTDTYTSGTGVFDITKEGNVVLSKLETTTQSESYITNESRDTNTYFTPVESEVVLGFVWNYSGNAWTKKADTIRSEFYYNTEEDYGISSQIRDNFLGFATTNVNVDYSLDSKNLEVTAGLSFNW